MSSATARIFSLLSTPFPLRHLQLSSPRLLFLSLSRPPSSLHLPRRFHFNALPQTPTDDHSAHSSPAGAASPFPDWYKLINSSQFSRFPTNSGFDEFVHGGLGLPPAFATSAVSCLAFARHHQTLLWSVSRKDVEVVVENGCPFLFKDSADTAKRMRLFLNPTTDDVPGSGKANTVDLMKFLLSYASTALVTSETNHFSNKEIVEESVKRLFSELAEISGAPGSVQEQFPETNGQLPGSFEQNIQMKRGDWICPRCRFMNFARNMKCLECEEARPKRQLTGGEWECPQCDFFNYGRNVTCMRCDCKKQGMSNPVSGSGYNYHSNNDSFDKPSPENQEKVQSWFHKISQLENTSNDGNASALGETFPLKEAVIPESSSTLRNSGSESLNVSFSQKMDEMLAKSIDASGASSSNSTAMGNNGSRSSFATSESASPSNGEFPDVMPMRKGESQFVVRERKDRSLTSPLYKRRMAMEQSSSNSYVPFVPFPPDYFSRDKQPDKEQSPAGNSSMPSSIDPDMPYRGHSSDQSRAEPLSNQQTSGASWSQRGPGESGNERATISAQNFQGLSNSNYHTPVSESKTYSKSASQQPTVPWRGSSLEGSAVKEPDPLDMSEEAKAERWFKRVAQIKDIKELSEIPDEDFPSIMPMRKGVNRFVVSKRKTPLERRLTSSQYRGTYLLSSLIPRRTTTLAKPDSGVATRVKSLFCCCSEFINPSHHSNA